MNQLFTRTGNAIEGRKLRGEGIVRDKMVTVRKLSNPGRDMFSNWQSYLWGLFLIAVSTALGHFLRHLFSLENIVMFYLLSAVISSIYFGLGPAIMVSILSIVTFDYFFIPPYLNFFPVNFQNILTLVELLVISALVSYLASRFRQKTVESESREREARTLFNLSRKLAKSKELDSSIQDILRMGKDIFGHDLLIFLPDIQNEGMVMPYAGDSHLAVDAGEYSIANWSFQNHNIAGRGTNTFPNAKAHYLPLTTPRGTVGVMSIWGNDFDTLLLDSGQLRLLQAFTDLTAVSIENIKLDEAARNAEILKAKEKLQTALLNSISHDLRTPLVSIIGVLSSLQEEGMGLDDTAQKNMVQVAREDAERLNHLIANLLDISRIETGAVKIFRQPSDVADLIGVALEQLGHRAAHRHIEINVPAELSFVNVDFNLIVQVLVNILDNAHKYSPPDSSIEIIARQVGKDIEIEIADHGIGISQQELPHIFDKFYRAQSKDNIPGTGLGLSICKAIVEAHGGYILAENRLGGGTIIKLTLPIEETKQASDGERND